MSIKIVLNGAGRIGKSILKQLLNDENFKIVAINEINPSVENIVYSINYDSTYGKLNDKFKVIENSFIQNQKSKIKITNYKDISELNLDGVDIIILTHPQKDADINIVFGVNEEKIDLKNHKIISTSSCNATALLPALKLIDDKKEILCGDIVTIHPLLNHQRVLDGSFVQSVTRDVDLNFEFGRSSTQNIIPSQTTTIRACSYVLEKFNSNLISSNSLRVPTDTVGVINVTLFTKEISSKDEIKNLFLEFEKNQNC